MRHVQLSEDGQLATLVSEVEAGESVTILRGERPVAQIVRFPKADEPTRAERMAALERLTAIMDKGYDMGLIWMAATSSTIEMNKFTFDTNVLIYSVDLRFPEEARYGQASRSALRRVRIGCAASVFE